MAFNFYGTALLLLLAVISGIVIVARYFLGMLVTSWECRQHILGTSFLSGTRLP